MKVLVLLFAVLFAGCTTVADIRTKNPYQILESDKTPKEIANCVLHSAPDQVGNFIYTLSENPPGTFNIFIGAQVPVGDVIFSPAKNGSHIEFRSHWGFWGKDAFWACIQKCASPKTPPENNSGK